jgi:hypothetical protein
MLKVISTMASFRHEIADVVDFETLPRLGRYFLANDLPPHLCGWLTGPELHTIIERSLKKQSIRLSLALRRQLEPSPEDKEKLKQTNALLDWCHSELFPFLYELDSTVPLGDQPARSQFLQDYFSTPFKEHLNTEEETERKKDEEREEEEEEEKVAMEEEEEDPGFIHFL